MTEYPRMPEKKFSLKPPSGTALCEDSWLPWATLDRNERQVHMAIQFDPRVQPSLQPRATRGILVASATLLVVVAVGFWLRFTPAATAFDVSILRQIRLQHSPSQTTIAVAIAWLFGPPIAAAITALIIAALYLFSRPRLVVAAKFAFLVGGTWLGSELVKLIVQRPRPGAIGASQIIETPLSFTYPSGHTAFAASLGLAVVILVWASRWRPLAIALTVVLVLLTGYSRMYLGVHYLTDVIASMIYSVAAITLLNVLFVRYLQPKLSTTRIP